jgi:molybdate transport system substrate-binding protein
MLKNPSWMVQLPKLVLFASLAAIAIESSARAAEITCLCAGPLEPAIKEIIPEFAKQTGHNVKASFAPIGTLTERIRKGESSDLATVSPQQWDELQREGKLVASLRVVVARIGIGVFVKKGAAKPDISSFEALKHALLGARSIAVNRPDGGSAVGAYMPRLFERLGISTELKSKIVTGRTLQLVTDGQAEIGLVQNSEILAEPSVELVGSLPAEVQNYTTFVAGIPTIAKEPAGAKVFAEFLISPMGITILRSKGLEPG